MLNTKRTRKAGAVGGASPGAGRWRLGAAALSLALLTGCQEHQQALSIFDRASSYNTELVNLGVIALGLSLLVFLGVSGLLFYTVFRFREDKNQEAPQQFHGNDKLEAWLIGIPVLIVLGLSVLSVRTMAVTTPVAEDRVGTHITALAKQFWWNFTYEDADAAAGGKVANGNEMVMPADKDVELTLHSGDVVHEFWAPNIGPQRQAIPNSEKVWTVHNNRPAIYQGNCNYLCGASHANMRYKVVNLPQAQFDAFMAAAKDYKAPEPAAGSPEENGYNLFMKGKPETGAMACAACHRIQGTPANGAVGPDLSFFGTRRTLGAGMWEAPIDAGWNDSEAGQHLINWITNSPGVKPGSLMPPYNGSTYKVNGQTQQGGTLSDKEIADIAAYLKTLQLPEEANYWKMVPVHNGGTQ